MNHTIIVIAVRSFVRIFALGGFIYLGGSANQAEDCRVSPESCATRELSDPLLCFCKSLFFTGPTIGGDG